MDRMCWMLQALRMFSYLPLNLHHPPYNWPAFARGMIVFLTNLVKANRLFRQAPVSVPVRLTELAPPRSSDSF